jgi:hypothetical protein
MRRTRGLAIALVLAAAPAGCASSSQEAKPSAAARRAQQNIAAICNAPNAAAARAAGGAAAVERGVGVLVADAKRRRDTTLAREAVERLRAGNHTLACGHSFAGMIELGLLPQTSRKTLESGAVSDGLGGFRRGAIGYYATHFGSGEDVAERECVTTSGGLFENVPALENFMYLLTKGNAQARQLLAHLRADCRAEGR